MDPARGLTRQLTRPGSTVTTPERGAQTSMMLSSTENRRFNTQRCYEISCRQQTTVRPAHSLSGEVNVTVIRNTVHRKTLWGIPRKRPTICRDLGRERSSRNLPARYRGVQRSTRGRLHNNQPNHIARVVSDVQQAQEAPLWTCCALIIRIEFLRTMISKSVTEDATLNQSSSPFMNVNNQYPLLINRCSYEANTKSR